MGLVVRRRLKRRRVVVSVCVKLLNQHIGLALGSASAYTGYFIYTSLKLTVSTCTTGIPFGPCAPHASRTALADRALDGSGFERLLLRSLK